MIIGRMNRRIELLKEEKLPDGVGGYVKSLKIVAKIWAEFRNTNFNTALKNADVVSDISREISIRKRSDVKKGWKISYKEDMYEVIHTYDISKETTMLVCREIVK